jgi:hypothetical protein
MESPGNRIGKRNLAVLSGGGGIRTHDGPKWPITVFETMTEGPPNWPMCGTLPRRHHALCDRFAIPPAGRRFESFERPLLVSKRWCWLDSQLRSHQSGMRKCFAPRSRGVWYRGALSHLSRIAGPPRSQHSTSAYRPKRSSAEHWGRVPELLTSPRPRVPGRGQSMPLSARRSRPSHGPRISPA